MTVVLAVRCSDGLVIGSDSQITESDRGMSYPAQKLHPLGDTAAWGGSGARAVLLDLEPVFDSEADEVLGARDIGRAIQDRVLPVLKEHYERFIPDIPGEESSGGPSAYVLAAGYSHGEPFIVEVNPNGMVGRFEDIGFHAVGSGAPMAHQAASLLANYQMAERDTRYGLVAVFRVLESLSETSPSVGAPYSLCRLTPEDGAEHLDDDEIDGLAGDLERWEELEQSALDELFG